LSQDPSWIDANDVYEFHAQYYNEQEARKIASLWDYYYEQAQAGDLSERAAYDRMTKSLKSETSQVANDIQAFEVAQSDERTTDLSPSDIETHSVETMSSPTEISLGSQDQGTSGGVSTAQTRNLGNRWIEANLMSVGYGSGKAWIETGGGFQPDESGEYTVTCDYYRRGSVSDGAAAKINVFVKELYPNNNRLAEELDSGTNRGQALKSEQFGLSGGNHYLIGVSLECSLNGLGKLMYSDYYSGYTNRHVEVESIKVEKAY
jgi:hypothetical protein